MKWRHWLIVVVVVPGVVMGILFGVGVFKVAHEVVEYFEEAELTILDSVSYEGQRYSPELVKYSIWVNRGYGGAAAQKVFGQPV